METTICGSEGWEAGTGLRLGLEVARGCLLRVRRGLGCWASGLQHSKPLLEALRGL